LKKLTEKQRLFVAEYCKDFNATQAAKRAGYSERTAGQTGHENLKKPEIQDAVREAVEGYLQKAQITTERVFEEYRRVAFSTITGFLSFGPNGVTWKDSAELTEEDAACIAEVSETVSEGGRTRRFKLHNKLSALGDLAKIMGMFPKEGAAPVSVNVSVDNRPVKPLSDFTDEELRLYESLLAPDAEEPVQRT